MSRDILRTLMILCALFAARDTMAESHLLADSTTTDRWTLPNGLQVVVRDVPGARAISIAWGYRIGQDHDPADRPGLCSLLAEVAFTAPAGDTPERTRDEMESLRPQGWSLRVTRRQTLFNETATSAQFPGALHQVATRMRGVTVTQAGLRDARTTVRQMLDERYFGAPGQQLHWQVREYARGLDGSAIVALAAAQGLDRETIGSVQQAIARTYVPANGVLALAGDFSGLDLRSIITSEFGDLPAGVPLPAPTPAPLDSVTVVLRSGDVGAPVGVLGIIAPALTDSLHPSFFMAMLVLGGRVREDWGPPTRPLGTRFSYAILDDPGFARLYPKPAAQAASDPHGLTAATNDVIDELLSSSILPDTYGGFRLNMLWMMGGPMPHPLVVSVRQDPAALNVLCTSLASQALWGDEAFWTEYRRRFDPNVSPGFTAWAGWFKDPAHQARLLLLPGR